MTLHESFVHFLGQGKRLFEIGPFSGPPVHFNAANSAALDGLPLKRNMLLEPWIDHSLRMWGLDSRDPELRVLSHNVLRYVLTHKWEDEPSRRKPAYTEDEKKIIVFLGSENEDQFVHDIRPILDRKVSMLLESAQYPDGTTPELKIRLNEIYEFAETAYNKYSKTPIRKSGEKYFCHALRVLSYTLDHLVSTGTKILTPEDIEDIVAIALLHDAKEDVGKVGVGKLVVTSQIPTAATNRQTYRYTILDTSTSEQTATEVRSLNVSHRTNASIDALTSKEVETDKDKFKQVVRSSPWSPVEIIKNMDRLDNVLTYRFSADSWWKYLYKMFESTVGMSRLADGSEVKHMWSEDITRALDEHVFHPSFDRRPVGPYVAYGLMLHALKCIRQDFLDEMHRRHGIHLRNTVLLSHQFEGFNTWDEGQFPDLFEVPGVSQELKADDIHQLSQSGYLQTYEQSVMNFLFDAISCGPNMPGYGRVFTRKMTPEEKRARTAIRWAYGARLLALFTTYAGTASMLSGNPSEQTTLLGLSGMVAAIFSHMYCMNVLNRGVHANMDIEAGKPRKNELAQIEPEVV